MLQELGVDAVCCDEAEISTALAVLVRTHVKTDGFKRVNER
jgi:hypothetical protein